MCEQRLCGPYSQCRIKEGKAVCSCLPGYEGEPPTCHPECISNSRCPSDKACINQKCVNPCTELCGRNSQCKVVRHAPICSCAEGFTGDPFYNCYLKSIEQDIETETADPCSPSPCGVHAECQNRHGLASCSCLPNYLGSPPNCHPECVTDQECLSSKVCFKEKCVDPCPGLCGRNAQCLVVDHVSICSCLEGYNGDPFAQCALQPLQG